MARQFAERDRRRWNDLLPNSNGTYRAKQAETEQAVGTVRWKTNRHIRTPCKAPATAACRTLLTMAIPTPGLPYTIQFPTAVTAAGRKWGAPARRFSPVGGALIAIEARAAFWTARPRSTAPAKPCPILLALYGDPGTSAYDTYTTFFNNVDTEDSGPVGFRWGGHGRNQGQISRLQHRHRPGTPHAADVIDALDGDSRSSTGGTSPGGTSPTTPTTPATLPALPVSIGFVTEPTASVIGSASGSVKLDLTNLGGVSFKGPVTITLYTSSAWILILLQ